MLFVIIAKDHADSTELRANTRPNHLEYLSSHAALRRPYAQRRPRTADRINRRYRRSRFNGCQRLRGK